MSDFPADVEAILQRRHGNGGDFWASSDGRIYVGNPFSTIASLAMLHELGVDREHEAVQGGLELILAACRADGRVRVAPKAPMYPCYTAEATRTMCRWGLTDRREVRNTLDYLLASTFEEGGWRCSFSRFGKGPETVFASPGATLYVLDVLRFFPEHVEGDAARGGVEALLHHWDVRTPAGPCHHGIGSRFLEVEFPFIRYNLFYWVYVLSFFPCVRQDRRFAEALALVEESVDARGRMVVGRPHRGLETLEAFHKGEPSVPATLRWEEIRTNVADG